MLMDKHDMHAASGMLLCMVAAWTASFLPPALRLEPLPVPWRLLHVHVPAPLPEAHLRPQVTVLSAGPAGKDEIVWRPMVILQVRSKVLMVGRASGCCSLHNSGIALCVSYPIALPGWLVPIRRWAGSRTPNHDEVSSAAMQNVLCRPERSRFSMRDIYGKPFCLKDC